MAYICTNCDAKSVRWEGKCSNCGEWDSLIEDNTVVDKKGAKSGRAKAKSFKAKDLLLKKNQKVERISTGFDELDRVLGGGVVPGSVSILSGEPGIGKSTILLQVASKISGKVNVLYVSGEESSSQLGSRLSRIAPESSLEKFSVTEDALVEKVINLAGDIKPDLMIVDSIQSVHSENSKSIAGSIAQVRMAASLITRFAKENNIAVFFVGQINKEGSIAGPKVLEHLVDVVLYFEGDEYSQYRIIRGVKNRFGATNEIGVFEMDSSGLSDVSNPSKVFIQESGDASGVAVGAVMQGSRVVFVEVQALVTERSGEAGPLRRVANGIKKPRLDMLCAVMARRAGVKLGDKDVFVNVTGGLNVSDPALDLAICAAIKSSVDDKVLSNESVYVGEVGLTGNIRKSFGMRAAAKEAKRIGYRSLICGASDSKSKFIQYLPSVKGL